MKNREPWHQPLGDVEHVIHCEPMKHFASPKPENRRARDCRDTEQRNCSNAITEDMHLRPNYDSTKIYFAHFGFYSRTNPGKRKILIHLLATAPGGGKSKLLDLMRQRLRLRHYSLGTEQAYLP